MHPPDPSTGRSGARARTDRARWRVDPPSSSSPSSASSSSSRMTSSPSSSSSSPAIEVDAIARARAAGRFFFDDVIPRRACSTRATARAMTATMEIALSDAATEPSVRVDGLTYAYPGHEAVVRAWTLALPPGSRCLLSGANGAGKTTALQVLAGKTMVSEDAVRVLGRPPFHDIALTCDGELSYLGAQWRRNIGSAGADVPLSGDISARAMIEGVTGVDPERRERLVKLLDVDLDWSMKALSDGQRRRVQICMGLLKPYKVLLCDEITVDLDILGRLDLLKFFKEECEQRGATIVYATHIFDGMADWMTHLAFTSNGELKYGGAKEDIPEIQGTKHLLSTIEKWLRIDRDERRVREAERAANPPPKVDAASHFQTRHMAYYR